MATFLDLTLFEHFSAIFMFLLVFVVTYGFLQVSNLFKDIEGKKGIYAIIAIAVAFLATMSKAVFMVIGALTPWFTVLIIFMFLMIGSMVLAIMLPLFTATANLTGGG